MTDDETVRVPAWAAREARDELAIAIDRTGGADAGAAGANTPLAEARDRVADADIDDHARGFVLGLIETVAADRSVDLSDSDPLTSRTFRARDAFDDALERQLEEVDDGE